LTTTTYETLDATGKTEVGAAMKVVDTFANKAAVQSALDTAVGISKPASDERAEVAKYTNAASAVAVTALLEANPILLGLDITNYAGLDATGKSDVAADVYAARAGLTTKELVQTSVTDAIATAKTESDDRATVAAAKSAIAGGTYTNLVVTDSTNQPIKTAAVQTKVNTYKGTTTATAAFDTDHYDVAISKGAASDTTTVSPVSFLETIHIAAIDGVTAPVKNAVPVTVITESDQYTGTIEWLPADANFAGSTVYTAYITITPKAGYTLTGVSANLFTVSGSDSDTNAPNSGIVTAIFPVTLL